MVLDISELDLQSVVSTVMSPPPVRRGFVVKYSGAAV